MTNTIILAIISLAAFFGIRFWDYSQSVGHRELNPLNADSSGKFDTKKFLKWTVLMFAAGLVIFIIFPFFFDGVNFGSFGWLGFALYNITAIINNHKTAKRDAWIREQNNKANQ